MNGKPKSNIEGIGESPSHIVSLKQVLDAIDFHVTRQLARRNTFEGLADDPALQMVQKQKNEGYNELREIARKMAATHDDRIDVQELRSRWRDAERKYTVSIGSYGIIEELLPPKVTSPRVELSPDVRGKITEWGLADDEHPSTPTTLSFR